MTDYNKPPIEISRSDHARLLRLADTLARVNGDLAEQLSIELDRAALTPDHEHGQDVVRMGTRLRFQTESGAERTVTLVFPHEADIALGQISVLTPIGVALIGLHTGDTMDWRSLDGRTQRLTVTQILAPVPANDVSQDYSAALS